MALTRRRKLQGLGMSKKDAKRLTPKSPKYQFKKKNKHGRVR